jgi:2-dehydro-3-deoxyphosphogluconate aldolase/(4S)-4-hydroxy-2-oxoglutarate aldolase
MNEKQILEKIKHYGVVPVIAIEKEKYALPLADALIAGDLPVAEITFRTKAAKKTISLIREARPEMIVGAGTVVTKKNLDDAKKCGAMFGVSPGFNPKIAKAAKKQGMPFIPGAITPSEVEAAMDSGFFHLKFFPAGAAGGLKTISGLFAPYKHLGVTFMPTGGVSVDNLGAYLSSPAVFVCGGTWLAKSDDMTVGRWDAISQKCLAARRIVKQINE